MAKPFRMIWAVLSSTLLGAAGAGAAPQQLVIPAAYGIAPQGVPAAPDYVGCWQTREAIYGGYRVAFCAHHTGAGAYRARGEGFDCQGTSSWRLSADGRRFDYQMAFGTCRPQAGWTADRIVCEPAAMAASWPGARAVRALDCAYYPGKPGERNVRFSAVRQ